MKEASEDRPLFEWPVPFLPLVAPLSRPVITHLVVNSYRGIAEDSWPPFDVVIHRALAKIARARADVFQYMDPFVEAAKKGDSRYVISEKWVLDALAPYTPFGGTNTKYSLEDWIQRGTLHRHGNRGPLEWNSVAALLIARIFDENLLKGWLPGHVESDEPRFWLWGKERPDADGQTLPFPLPETLPASTLLFSLWEGMIWQDKAWETVGAYTVRFAGTAVKPSDVQVWDGKLSRELEEIRLHPQFACERV